MPLSAYQESETNLYQVKIRRRINLLFAAIASLIATGAAIGLFKLFLFHHSPCSFINAPTEFQLLECEKYTSGVECAFSVSQCKDACPLGFETDDYGCPVSCLCAIKGTFESDIMFNPNTLSALMKTYIKEEDTSAFIPVHLTMGTTNLWNNYVVNNRVRIPYVLSRDIFVDQEHSKALQSVFHNLSSQTCIDFYPRKNESNFVEFVNKKKTCSSFIGQIGGRQQLNIGSRCLGMGSIMHQVMHLLGFLHEHTRPDRNDYIVVIYQNILKGFRHNFQRRGRSASFNYPYDENSLTHFDGHDFSLSQFPTLLNRMTQHTIVAQRNWLSKIDKAKINEIYCVREKNKSGYGYCPSCTDFETGDMWESWSVWSLCSSSCGDGQTVRIRECIDASGNEVYFGRCQGDHFEAKLCSAERCKRGMWSPWSPCSVTCGTGRMTRESCCDDQSEYEEKSCVLDPCNYTTFVGVWSSWKSWGDCSNTCNAGWQKRSRSCEDLTNQTLLRTDCPYTLPGKTEFRNCPETFCTINDNIFGNWASWSTWSLCSATCGDGILQRNRLCLRLNKASYNISLSCMGKYSGKDVEIKSKKCHLEPCGIHVVERQKKTAETQYNLTQAEYSEWSAWGICTKSCQGGKRYRTKKCGDTSNKSCKGYLHEVEFCNVFPCEIVPATFWSPWTDWSPCSSWCHGTRWRKRLFLCRSSSKCGNLPYVDVKQCNKECITLPKNITKVKKLSNEDTPKWDDWSSWSQCTRPCGGGVKWKRRECLFGRPGSTGCVDSSYAIESCNQNRCTSFYYFWAAWGEWSACSTTCYGTRSRRRTYACLSKQKCVPSPSINIEPCNTECGELQNTVLGLAMSKDKNNLPIKNVPTWSDWSPWVECTKSCGRGIEWRQRRCQFVVAGQETCKNNSFDTRPCNTHDCLPVWNQTSIFCEHFLQVVDFNGDGFADLVCINDQPATKESKSSTIKMKVAINARDGSFVVQRELFNAKLFEVECTNDTDEEAEIQSSKNSSTHTMKKKTGIQITEGYSDVSHSLKVPSYQKLPIQRRADKGFCPSSSKDGDANVKQAVSTTGDFLHVFCYDNNGRLLRAFFNLTTVNARVP